MEWVRERSELPCDYVESGRGILRGTISHSGQDISALSSIQKLTEAKSIASVTGSFGWSVFSLQYLSRHTDSGSP